MEELNVQLDELEYLLGLLLLALKDTSPERGVTGLN